MSGFSKDPKREDELKKPLISPPSVHGIMSIPETTLPSIDAIIKSGNIYPAVYGNCFTRLFCCQPKPLYFALQDIMTEVYGEPGNMKKVYFAHDPESGTRLVIKQITPDSSELFWLQALNQLQTRRPFLSIQQMLPALPPFRSKPVLHTGFYAILQDAGNDLCIQTHQSDQDKSIFFRRFLLPSRGVSHSELPKLSMANIPDVGIRACIEIVGAIQNLFQKCNAVLLAKDSRYGSVSASASISRVETHGDIKPDNLCFTNTVPTTLAFPKATLVDFEVLGETERAKRKGTLQYLAPELWPFGFRTKTGKVLPGHESSEPDLFYSPSVSSDIFAFGCTIYYFLRQLMKLIPASGAGGQSNFPDEYLATQGDKPKLIIWDDALLRAFLTELSKIGFPDAFCKLLSDCLSLDPGGRPENWETVLTQLEHIQLSRVTTTSVGNDSSSGSEYSSRTPSDTTRYKKVPGSAFGGSHNAVIVLRTASQNSKTGSEFGSVQSLSVGSPPSW